MTNYVIYFETVDYRGIAVAQGRYMLDAVEDFESWYSNRDLFLSYGSLVTVTATPVEDYKIFDIRKKN